MTDDRRWENGWDGHQAAQLRRLAELSLAEKLQWLEDAARVVQHMLGSARKTATAIAPTRTDGTSTD